MKINNPQNLTKSSIMTDIPLRMPEAKIDNNVATSDKMVGIKDFLKHAQS